MVFLFFRAVMQEQLTGTQRIRHHDGNGASQVAAGQFHHDRGVGLRGKFESPVGLRNDHAEHPVLAHEVPEIARQAAVGLADFPVVRHAAEFLDRAIDECLLAFRQRRGRYPEEAFPARPAGKYLALPPDGTGFQCLALGGRHPRQGFAE
ncbi:MAG: hypothetical protein MUE63_08390 [Xanthomonadales bacterium]|nr:hypothetical protein [Xanthomonadales bacterium]